MSKGPLHRFAQSIAPNWAKGLYHRANGAMNRRKSTADVFSTIYSSKQWGSSGDFNSGAGTVDGGVANPYVEAIRDCLDKQGPDIRLYWNSGVFLDQPPFSLPSARLEEILSVPGTPIWKGEDPGEIVTWVYRPA
jgi:hypothetical protein